RLLETADFVTLHATLHAQNIRMIGRAQFKRMKRTAFLINTARGALVDETTLAEALAEHRIAGAALDVFDPEPLAVASPLLSADLAERTIFSPHTAGMTEEGLFRAPLAQVESCVRVLRGEVPDSVVNEDVLPRSRALRHH